MRFILMQNTGCADYITLKAVKKITAADVVCYDAHTDRELLGLAPKTCVLLGGWMALERFMNRYTLPEPLTIVRMTEERDSTVSGELLELERYGRRGFALELVPGVSNINRFSAGVGFLLTARNRNESFWVWDGNAGEPDAPAIHTVKRVSLTRASIVLMNPGSKASMIITAIRHCRNPDTPVFLIAECGTIQRLSLNELQGMSDHEWAHQHLVLIQS